MIQNVGGVNRLSSAQAADPFQAFSVEFGDALQAPQFQATPGVEAPSFGDVLLDALNDVSAQQRNAEKTAFDFATGKPVDVHTMMIEMAKADVLVQVTSTVVSKTATGINTLLQTQV